MGFLKKLFGGVTAKPEKRYYSFRVKCSRCGEVIEGRVDLDNDLSLDYEGDSTVYFVRKGLVGNNRCFQQIEVESPSLGTMKIRIISAQYGTKVPDSRFTFTAPKDVRVVDLSK